MTGTMPIQRNEMSEKIIITGLVNKPKEFGYSDLALLPDQIKDVSTLAPGREGVGVKLSAIMAVVEPKKDVQYITLEAEGDFAASIPLDAVLDQAIVWYGLDGGPLPVEKGGPIRFLIPDPAACGTDVVDQCANVKWLKSIEMSAERGRDIRPTTLRAHEELHEKEKRGEQSGL